MAEKIEELTKIMAILMAIFSVTVIGFMLWISYAISKNSKDFVKSDLLKIAVIKKDDLTFKVQKGYASALVISYNSQTVYSQDLGREVSKLTVKNYPSIIQDKQIYNFMLYHYALGGYGFSGFDFCVNNQKFFYGKAIINCLKNGEFEIIHGK